MYTEIEDIDDFIDKFIIFIDNEGKDIVFENGKSLWNNIIGFNVCYNNKYFVEDKGEFATIDLFTIFNDCGEFTVLKDVYYVSFPIKLLDEFIKCLYVINDNVPYVDEFNKSNIENTLV